MERAAIEEPYFASLKDKPDALLKSLQKKGYAHEETFFQTLIKEPGTSFVNIQDQVGKRNPQASIEATLTAMAEGIDVIFQGCLADHEFRGYADFLIKVKGRSALGDYHYEVWDTKLSSTLKPYFIVQLCCYVQMLEKVQGRRPDLVTVVLGTNEQVAIRVDDYYYSYLAIKQQFLELQSGFDLKHPINPADYAKHGDWSDYAKGVLLEQDDLTQVANITRSQIVKLRQSGINTMQALADTTQAAVPKIQDAVFDRLKHQASIQKSSAGQTVPRYEVLTHDPSDYPPRGLAVLPPPSKHDIFFDIEGDPLYPGGLEYLWGVTYFNEQGQRDFRDKRRDHQSMGRQQRQGIRSQPAGRPRCRRHDR
jgi:uncharacterized protein